MTTPRSLALLGRVSARIAPDARAIALAALVFLGLAAIVPDLRPLGLALIVLAGALTAAVLPHELAHAAVAQLHGLRVTTIALGFGPALAGYMLRGTRYELRLIPAGGFAHIEGLEAAPARVRVLTALAGPAANLLLAIALLVAATTAAGAPDLGRAASGALEIGTLLFTGTAQVAGAWAADPANLTLLPIGGIPSAALAAGGSIAGGLPMLCILVAALSLAVGLVNLLPWPPLDGSIAAAALTGRSFGRRSALAVDGLLVVVVSVNLLDAVRVALLVGGG